MQGAFAGFFCDASVIFFSVAGMVRLCYDIFQDRFKDRFKVRLREVVVWE